MSTKIRLKRMGAKRRPFYRIVVTDSRNARNGRAIDTVGYYDPLTDPATVNVDEEKVLNWLSRGVQVSDTAKDLLKRKGIIKKWKSGAGTLKQVEDVERKQLPVI